MKIIRQGAMIAAVFAAALGSASAQSAQRSNDSSTTMGAPSLTQIDCMDRDGGPSGCPPIRKPIDCMDRDGGPTGCDVMGVRDAAMRGMMAQAKTGFDAPVVPGFQLASARSDIVAGHTSQVLIYKSADKEAVGSITLCVWPSGDEPAKPVSNVVMKGVNVSYWNDGHNEFWAASTEHGAPLDGFVRALTKS